MAVTQTPEQGCSFFDYSPAKILTPESFAPDEKLMISEADSFCRKEVLPLQDRLDSQEPGLMVDLVKKAGLLGFCGVDAPEEHGGLGLHKSLAAAILERLSLNASFSVTYGITSGISQFGLIAFGTEEQKAKYLPRLTSGEWIGAYALSEPNSGSDALSLTTRAEEKGDKWILNGTKMWISNAQWADLFLVMAQVPGEGICAFLVEKNAPGVSISREEHKMGLKGSSTARLILENAEVPLDSVIHEPGKGHQVAFNALNMGRFKLGAMSLGPARYAIECAVRYSKERKQFGRPLCEFGQIRRKLADMASWFFAAESALYRCGGLIDAAFAAAPPTAAGVRQAAEEFAVECSMVKILCTEAEDRIVDEALQIYGGYGFTEEFPLARIYRDARVSRIYEGTNEVNRLFTATRFLRRHPQPATGLDHPLAAWALEALTQVDKDTQRGIAESSDLLMGLFSVQAAQARAAQTGAASHALAAQRWEDECISAGGASLRRLSARSMELPSPLNPSTDEIAEAILQKEGPL